MLRLAPLLLILPLLAACGGGGGGGGGPAGPLPRIDYFVDGTNGNDAAPGTQAQPFETITHALAVARSAPVRNGGDNVHVLPGTYDAAKETFPLVVREGINLLGSGVPYATILGGGMAEPTDAQNITAAVVLRAGAQLGYFKITNTLGSGDPGLHFGALMAGDDTHINIVEFSGSRHGGIRVEKGDVIEIAACVIRNHTSGIGIHFAGGGQDGHVRLCEIYGNRIGVEYDAPGARLNGLAQPSGQDNELYGNSHTDLWVLPGVVVNASYNRWDHTPPWFTTQNNTGGGIDIYAINGAGDVNVTGASQVTP